MNNFLEENYPNEKFLFLDGYDDCFLGIAAGFNEGPKSCYDFKKIISKLESQGMTNEEAIEYFEYNIIGSYLGKETPIFLNKI